jgi:hypothetical protein
VKIQAIVSRSFLWRLMILAAGVRFVVGPPFQGVSQFPWISAAYVSAAIVVLHPVMDKDLPTLVGPDMLKSLRTYIGAGLLIAAYYHHSGVRLAYPD